MLVYSAGNSSHSDEVVAYDSWHHLSGLVQQFLDMLLALAAHWQFRAFEREQLLMAEKSKPKLRVAQ